MHNRVNIIRPLLAALSVAVLLPVACGPDAFLDRRPLYENVRRTPRVRLEVDWMSQFGQKPAGMTVMMPGMSGKNSFSTLTNEVDGIDLSLEEDSYRTLIFNRSADEFSSLDFHDVNDYDSIHVTLTRKEANPDGSWDKGFVYADEPEDLGVALDTITITPEMVEDYSAIIRHRLADGIRGDKVDTVMYIFHETPVPVYTKLNIIVRVLGLSNVMSVEGNIENMSDGYYLTAQHSASTECTHGLKDWKMHLDSVGSRNGYITTSIKTFGLPHGTEEVTGRDSLLSYLNLHFRLRDNSTTVQYHYAVGDLFKYVKVENGVSRYTQEVTHLLELRINADTHPNVPDIPPDLPDVEDRTEPGFNAGVDEWDEERKDVYF